MAEEEKVAEEGEEKSGGGKKTIIIIAIAVILAIGVSVGVTIFLLGGDDASPEEVVNEEDLEPTGPMQYQPLGDKILVTFDVSGRQRFMQVYLTLGSRWPESFNALEHHKALIRSRLNSLYGSQDFAEMRTDAGKLALAEKTLATINEALEAEGEKLIEKVYFTNFVMQ